MNEGQIEFVFNLKTKPNLFVEIIEVFLMKNGFSIVAISYGKYLIFAQSNDWTNIVE
jgi:hypothetical protein